MKKAFLALIAIAFCYVLSAQPKLPNQPATDPANAQAPFMKFPTIPPFHLLALDSTSYLTPADLKKGRKTLVMYFSPDCEHCKHQTESILADWEHFKDMNIVMATYQPFSEMKEFNKHYKMYEHSNVRIGRDEKFVLPPFYKIRSLPYLALYDKKGHLITTFEGTQKTETIIDAFSEKVRH
ncbi:MAG TPA: thioredoxin fold domain-containing protein [Puia sp.]|nr:thioredoxin fold domain-containing protein [Puia sp.]